MFELLVLLPVTASKNITKVKNLDWPNLFFPAVI
jgi:hypothetical protein